MTVMFLVVPAMIVLTFVLGVPVALAFVARQSRGALLACVGWVAAMHWELLPSYAGPLGMPWIVFWPVVTVFGAMFLRVFVRLTARSWTTSWRTWMLIRAGMPAREII